MPRKVIFEDDNPEWTEKDFQDARPSPMRFCHPISSQHSPKTRGPQKAALKVPVSIRLSPEVVDYFKAGGPGWQGRIDEALRSRGVDAP